MSITKPYTFVAGRKARANEVNADFDTVYSQVNSNLSSIAEQDLKIQDIDNTKAEVNGSAGQRFAVADAVNGADAINKNTFKKYTNNTKKYIDGMRIIKDSGSPKDSIIVTAGSCYDSTYEVVINILKDTSKKNDAQGADATYYVHAISNKVGGNYDVLISSQQINPPLPDGYAKYRCVGSYSTNTAGEIDEIKSFNGSIDQIKSFVIEEYKNGINGYRIYSDGYCEQWGESGEGKVTFLRKFKDNNYLFLYGLYSSGGGDQDASYCPFTYTPDKKNDSMVLRSAQRNAFGRYAIYWYVAGYIK